MLPTFSPQLSARIDAASRTMHILWLALMASVAMYGFTLFMIMQQPVSEPTPLPLPPFVFPIIAVAIASTAVLFYRQLTSADRIRALVQENRPGEQDAALSKAEQRLNRVPALVFTSSIIRWALFESIAIIGLVLGILNRSLEDFVPYGVAAIVLMASTPPKLRQVTLSAAPLLPSDA